MSGWGACGTGAPSPGCVFIAGLVYVAVAADGLSWGCGWRSWRGFVVFNAFARGEEDTRGRFLEWFWCSLCGCVMFFAARLRLEGWCIGT